MKIIKLLVEQDGYKDIHLYIYPTIRSIYEVFFDGDLKNKHIETFSEGELIKTPVEEAIKNGKDYGGWGFEEDKEKLHLWFNPDISFENLVSLLAYEIGHFTKPHHRNKKKEEAKAQHYQDVTEFAISLANTLRSRAYAKP